MNMNKWDRMKNLENFEEMVEELYSRLINSDKITRDKITLADQPIYKELQTYMDNLDGRKGSEYYQVSCLYYFYKFLSNFYGNVLMSHCVTLLNKYVTYSKVEIDNRILQRKAQIVAHHFWNTHMYDKDVHGLYPAIMIEARKCVRESNGRRVNLKCVVRIVPGFPDKPDVEFEYVI